MLKEIGLGGAVWLASSLTMVFVFQPIFMSYLPRPRIRERELARASAPRARGRGWFHTRSRTGYCSVPVTPGLVRSALLILRAAVFILWGVVSGQRADIGYETPGTPLYNPDSKVNQDIAEIGKFFPTDEGWVILDTPDYPDPAVEHRPGRLADDLRPRGLPGLARRCAGSSLIQLRCDHAAQPNVP